MSPSQVIGLHENLPRVKAQDQIRRCKFDETDYETVYSLYLLAHGDENLAQQRRTESLNLHVDEKIANG